MLAFPNAKINLGLNILSRRPDGYHNIETCMYPAPWHDVLEVLPSDNFEFRLTGLTISGNRDDNICVRAYQLLRDDLGIGPAAICLHKVIPMGAGLGGGSADGAYTLRLLNHVFEIGLSRDELMNYAAQLGSDCPFFIDNLPAVATGTGTDLARTTVDLSGWYVAILYPEVHINTKEAYAGIQLSNPSKPLSELLNQPVDRWHELIRNDFETTVLPSYPEIASAKKQLIDAGAVYASMSGSGSAVYGLFREKPSISTACRHIIEYLGS